MVEEKRQEGERLRIFAINRRLICLNQAPSF